MRVTNNIGSDYYQTYKAATPAGKFSEVMADAMHGGKRTAETRRNTDIFERTSHVANRTKDTIELSAESQTLAKADESKSLAKADEITMTQEQIDMLSEKYSPSDFYYVNPQGEIAYHMLYTGGKGKVEEFYQDIKEMGLVSEEDYDLLRIRELWFNERTGIRNVETGEWITPEYFGREYRKELIDKYGEEEAEERIAKILDRGIGQGELSDVLRKLAGILQDAFHAESPEETDMIVQAYMKSAENFEGWTDSWTKAQNVN